MPLNVFNHRFVHIQSTKYHIWKAIETLLTNQTGFSSVTYFLGNTCLCSKHGGHVVVTTGSSLRRAMETRKHQKAHRLRKAVSKYDTWEILNSTSLVLSTMCVLSFSSHDFLLFFLSIELLLCP